jgi:HlyD family secretion protein
MPEERQGIFRKQALERMSSPERLDQLIQIVSPKDWFLLAILLTLGALLIAWCVWGQLPTTVSGQGIIIRPNKIMEIQSQAAGRLADFSLHTGDQVKKGELIGVIDESPIRRQVEDDRARLAVLEAEDRKQNSLQGQQARLQDRDFTAHQNDLHMQIASLNEGVHHREALRGVFKKRLDALHESINEGIEPRVSYDLLETEKENLDNEVRISEIDTQRSDLESQINRIETQRTELSRSLLQSSNQRQNQILELRRNVEVAQVQLENNTRILSEYGGRVVEIAAHPGQAVNAGSRLASLELQEAASNLVCVAYFGVGEGKQIRPGMRIQVTPDSVKRERFGGIVGGVSSVSAFPVTKVGAVLMLGSPEVADRMLRNDPQIEVLISLEKDGSTYSGFRWSSSKGPQIPITAGTTTSARVTVETRAPITYLLPILRGALGVN